MGGQVIPSDVPGSLSMGIRQPAGVAVGIAPWNAPVIPSARAAAEAMVAHPAVRRLDPTGSTRVGRIIGEVCARRLVPAVLEPGGKDPLLVRADADIDAAVQGATFGGFVDQGHVCMSTDEIVVDESIADEFVARVESLPCGDPRTEDVVLGPVIGQGSMPGARWRARPGGGGDAGRHLPWVA